MSRYTSFVAVDNQVVSKDGKPELVPQPVEMPQGVSYEGVFGATKGERGESRLGMMSTSAGAAMAMPAAPSPAFRGIAGTTQLVTVPGRSKSVDVKSSDVSHVTTSKEILSLPVESVPGVVPLNSGVTVQGDEPHVRGGREEKTGVRIDGVPVDDPSASAGRPTLRVYLEAVPAVVRVGERIRIRVIVKNEGSQPVTLPRELDLRDGSLQLRVSVLGQPPVAEPLATRRLATQTILHDGRHPSRLILSVAPGVRAP